VDLEPTARPFTEDELRQGPYDYVPVVDIELVRTLEAAPDVRRLTAALTA
jgi:hypothetical protein